MMTDEDRSLAEYVIKNRERFTDEALREQLLGDGHSSEAVERAFETARAESATDAGAQSTVDVRLVVAGLALAAYIVVYLLAASRLGASAASAENWLESSIARTASGLLAVLLLVMFLISVAVIARIRPVPRASAVGAVVFGLIAPLVLLLVVTGICIGVAA